MAQRTSLSNAMRKSLKAVGSKVGLSNGSGKGATYEDLVVLMDEIWQEELKASPELATFVGVHDYDAEVSDISEEAVQAERKMKQAFLDRLMTSFPDSERETRAKTWTLDNRVTLGIVKNKLETEIKNIDLKEYLICVHTMGSPHTNWPQILPKMKVDTLGDLKTLQSRLSKVSHSLDQYCERLKVGLAEGVTPPRVSVAGIPDEIRSMVNGTPNTFHVYIDKVFEEFKGDSEGLHEVLKALIDDEILPAFMRFADFLETEYVPNLDENLSVAGRCANGEALYAHYVKSHTTTDLSPEEIHQIGLDEVDRIMNTMKEIATSEGFDSVEAYQEHLDATFFFDTEEKLLNYYKGVAMNIAPKLPSIIGKLPRTPFGVKAVPSFYGPSAPPAYYEGPPTDLSQAGFFSLNTYKPETRKTYISNALVLHEGCPGHHLQIALATENGDIHNVRKYAFYTAYIEGWGLYCEYLGHEMGMYEKPEQHYGRLVIEMMRACRLVVDTGMNGTFGWSKEKAMEYMLVNKAGTPGDIDSETTRYVAIPGQALSYKIGEIKIRELRSKCESELGDKFSIRAFHDLVLGVGAVPLDTLEELVQDWISEQQ
mmetsp:Transcript_17799/g.31445  ORF Transcript_17799/g.31445 Transcript_17799/m.31445 type:complete len:597 (-) Transcript_17799:95-1885(-)